MAKLTAKKRHGMNPNDFGLSGERFPMKDKTHQRLAIGGATKSYNAGNISKSEEEEVKRKARARLGMSAGERITSMGKD